MALIETLTDDFTTQDTGKWTFSSGDAFVIDGRLHAICTSAYPTVKSVSNYDLTASSAYVRAVWDAGWSIARGAGSTDYFFGIEQSQGNAVEFDVNNGTIYAQYIISNVFTVVDTGAYDPVAHAWWRIREASGTIFWEVSADGSSWNSFASVAAPITITSIKAYLGSGYWGTEVNPGTAVFDNFNVAPTARAPVDLASSGTGAVASSTAGGTSLALAYPSLTVNAGETAAYYAYVHVRGAGRTVTTPSGWWPVGSYASTNTSAEAAGVGPTRTWVFKRTSTTALTSTQSFTISAQATSGVAQGFIRGYVASGTNRAFEEVIAGWSNPTSGTGGGSTTPNGSISVLGGDIDAKDEIHISLGIADDDNTAASIGSITATGATIGSASATGTRTVTGNGNDLATAGFAAQVTAGPNSGTTLSIPVSQTPANQMHAVMVRVRATADSASKNTRDFFLSAA